MPNYTVRNRATGEVVEMTMKIAEMEEMLKNDPDLEIAPPSRVNIGDPFQLGRIQPDSKFKTLMRNMKKKNPGNTIDGSFI